MKLLIVKEYRTNEKKIFYGVHLKKKKKNPKKRWHRMRVVSLTKKNPYKSLRK